MNKELEVLITALETVAGDDVLPDEEQLLSICRTIADAIYDNPTSKEPIAGYARVLSWVRAQYATERYKDGSKEAAFDLGALWGVMNVYESCTYKLDERLRNLAKDNTLDRRRNMFEAVAGCPGITHGKLAKACGMTPPALTQAVEAIDEQRLLVISRNGKEKHYFLSTYADQWLKAKRAEAAKVSVSNNNSNRDRCYTEAWIIPPAPENATNYASRRYGSLFEEEKGLAWA